MSAGVAAAAVVTAGVTFALLMVMMAASYIGVVVQLACQECCNCCIRITAATAIDLDAVFCQSHLCAAADAAANQCICACACQEVFLL